MASGFSSGAGGGGGGGGSAYAAPNPQIKLGGQTYVLNGVQYNAAGDPIGSVLDDNYTPPTQSASVASTPQLTPEQIAQYDQSIGQANSALGRLPNQLDIGNANIDTGYQQALNPLDLTKSQATRNYNDSKVQNSQQFVTTKNQIADQASNGLRGLLRLLGAHGAGGSSEARFVAPQAVAGEATQQRAGAGQNFGQNNKNLDTNFGDFTASDTAARGNLANQRDQQKRDLQAKIDTTKSGLLSSLGQLVAAKTAGTGGNGVAAYQPYIDQTNSLANDVDNLGRLQPAFTPQTTAYQAPSLGSYIPQANTAQVNNPNAATDQATPYLSLLLGQKDKNAQLGF